MTCTYQNISGGRLWLQDEAKRQREILVDATFDGSAFYKRYVNSNTLELVTDDGSVWPETWPIAPGSEGAGAVARSNSVTVAAGNTWTDSYVDYESVIGGPAYYLDMETDQDVWVRINGDSASDFLLEGGSIRRFDRGDILISLVQFDASSSGAVTAQVSLFALGIPQ